MKNEELPTITLKTKHGEVKFGGHWYRGKTCNFIPSKKLFLDDDFFKNYILKGYEPKKPFINKKSKIIAFGSCFASSVSEFLSKKDYNVFNKQYVLNSHIIRYGEGMANTFTVLEQLEWAFENKNIEKNTWYYNPNEELDINENIRQETLKLLKKIDVFIITVGLSEVWFNKANNQVFWKAIPADKFDEKKHGFRLSTVQENTENLNKIFSIIKKNLPEAKVIYTLSPIPLMATFRQQSCITANSISKSILRVALDNVITENKNEYNLYYFPSYEMVKDYFNDPFMEDNRHLRNEFTQKIMGLFEESFCF